MSKEKEKKPLTPFKAFMDKFLFSSYIVALILAVCFSAFVLFQKNYFEVYWVNGQSMWPTLNKETRTADGELFNENKLSMDGATGVDLVISDPHDNVINKLKRFDIIVCKYRSRTESDKIKRVIALPGETFYIESAPVNSETNGALYVLNEKTGTFEYIEQPVPKDYITRADYPNYSTPTKLADNEYFVMGDNRLNSGDSRTNGPVTRDKIQGKAIALVARCRVVYNLSAGEYENVDINYMWPRFF